MNLLWLSLAFILGLTAAVWRRRRALRRQVAGEVVVDRALIEGLRKRIKSNLDGTVHRCATFKDMNLEALKRLDALAPELGSVESLLERQPDLAYEAERGVREGLVRAIEILNSADKFVEPLVGRVREAAKGAVEALIPLWAECADRSADQTNASEFNDLGCALAADAALAGQAPVRALRGIKERLRLMTATLSRAGLVRPKHWPRPDDICE